MTTVLLIAAYNSAGYIGKDGDLMYKITEDMNRFKAVTKDGILIMGRKTYESLPFQLPERSHIVVTSNTGNVKPHSSKNPFLQPAPVFCSTVEEAYKLASIKALREPDLDRKICFIGGESIYRQCLPYINQANITVIMDDKKGDVKFPEDDFLLTMAKDFKLIRQQARDQDGINFVFNDYRRKDLLDETPFNYVETLGERTFIVLSDQKDVYRVRPEHIQSYHALRHTPVIVVTTTSGKIEMRYQDSQGRDRALVDIDDFFTAA